MEQRKIETDIKEGDFFQIGSHFLFCGSSASLEILKKVKEIFKKEFVLCVTDPPFAVNYDPSWRLRACTTAKVNYIKSKDDTLENNPLGIVFSEILPQVAYVYSSNIRLFDFYDLLRDNYKLADLCYWVKQSPTLNRGCYNSQVEPCLFLVRKNHKYNWQGARDQSNLWFEKKLNYGNFEPENEKTEHACQKPVALYERPIINNSTRGQFIFDPFVGSGTCIIAAERTERKCIGIELLPEFCQIAIDRIKKLFPNIEIKKLGSI